MLPSTNMVYDVTKDAKLVNLFHYQKRVKTRNRREEEGEEMSFLVACTVHVYNE